MTAERRAVVVPFLLRLVGRAVPTVVRGNSSTALPLSVRGTPTALRHSSTTVLSVTAGTGEVRDD